MDRLITVDAKELQLPFSPNKPCISHTFTITNLMHTMSVAVSLSTTDPSLFSFKPSLPLSILPPLSSISFSLLSPPSPFPPSLSSRPPSLTLSIRSSMLPTGKAQPSDLRRIFASPGRHIFHDASLPISFTGPHVVDCLLHSPQKTIQAALLLSKAVAGCSREQISSLLLDAAGVGNVDFVSALIDAGGDVNCKGSDGSSALAIAVASGHVGVIRVLIDSGAEFDPCIDWYLHDAAAANRVDLLEALSESCGLNSLDSSSRAPAHYAAARGHVEALRFCVSSGGDPGLVDLDGWTPLHCAAAEGRLDAVEFLLEQIPFTKYAVTKDGKTPFSLAIDDGHFHLLDVLRLGDVLHRAAGLDDVHGLKSCVSQGAKVNGRDQNGWTALHRAAFKGRLESVKLLISHGAQMDLVDNAGYTPLRCAVEAGHAQVAMYLIAQGAACVNPKSLKGVRPLNFLLSLPSNPAAIVPFCGEKEQNLN